MTFTYSVTVGDWVRIAPELVLAVTALIIMLADLALPQNEQMRKVLAETRATSIPGTYLVLPLIGLLGTIGAIIATILLFISGDYQSAFNHMLGADRWTLLADLILLTATGVTLLLSPAYLRRLEVVHQGEYYALIVLSALGMLLLAGATSFLVVFLGIEMLSLALYILCGYISRRQSSQEAGMKYFLLSSFASAFLLYGIALIYGATGKTTFVAIQNFLATHPTSPFLLLLGLGLLMVGFAFKVSAIPFQAWTPDVYEGAPGPITAFMSVATKAAAFIAFARVFDVVLQPVQGSWLPIAEVLAIVTIIGGNVLAIVQSNLKRLLAYSSVAHAGYLLLGIIAGGSIGLSAILFYLGTYTFMNLGAYGIASMLEQSDNSGNSLAEIKGLWYRRPALAGLLAFFLLSLAGFPPMAGFAAKFYIFYAVLQSGHPELLIVGVLASILGIYYYLKVIAAMFMDQEEAVPAVAVGGNGVGVLGASGGDLTPAVVPASALATVTREVTATITRTAGAMGERAQRETYLVGWTGWLAIGIAVVGTLAMGTVLPFWLINLAQEAAKLIM